MEKKTKLTISGGIAKKSIKNIDKAKNLGKNSVIIEKQTGKFTSRGGSFKSNPSKIKNNFTSNKGTFGKPNYIPKSPPLTSDFERRKLAEQRATKRLKEENENKNKKSIKSNIKKRELKLTVSRALSDEIEARERSLASVKRAREKENKIQSKDLNKESLKPIKRDRLMLTIHVSPHTEFFEEPKFKILVDEGELEIRSYDEYLVAETAVEGSFDTASRKGFRRVAGYIFRENKNSIGQSEKIQMTAPVTVKPDNEGWVLHFVMPSNYDMSQLPVPNNSSILLKKIEAHLAAVIIFSGFTTDAKIQNKTEELKVWLEKQNFKIAGPQQIARYNDPFTLPWRRRNEIIFKVTAGN